MVGEGDGWLMVYMCLSVCLPKRLSTSGGWMAVTNKSPCVCYRPTPHPCRPSVCNVWNYRESNLPTIDAPYSATGEVHLSLIIIICARRGSGTETECGWTKNYTLFSVTCYYKLLNWIIQSEIIAICVQCSVRSSTTSITEDEKLGRRTSRSNQLVSVRSGIIGTLVENTQTLRII